MTDAETQEAPTAPAEEAPSPQRGRSGVGMRALRLLLASVLIALTLAGLAVSLAGFAARYHWLAELATHLHLQLALGLGVVAIGLAALRSNAFAAVALVVAAINMLFVLPLFLPTTAFDPVTGRPLTVLLANVHRENREHEAVVSVVRKERPEVAVFLEVDRAWMEGLAPLRSEYPYEVSVPRDDDFGIAVFSRDPLTRTETFDVGSRPLPALVTRLERSGGTVTLVAAHTPPPISKEYAADRNEVLRDLATVARESGSPLVLCGDLNLTPWSPYFGDLLRGVGLRHAARGFGLLPTWNANLPSFLGLPIDHCLVTPDVGVRGARRGPHIGSDHYPLIVDLVAGRL